MIRSRPRTMLYPLMLASLSGGLCALAIPPFDLWPLALVCWVPLIVALSGHSWKQAMIIGLVQGVTVNGLTQGWVAPALREVAGYPSATALLLVVAFTLWQGSRSAALALLTTLGIRRGWSPMVMFPVALVVIEGIYPMLFPWPTAVFLNAQPTWLQLADLGGPLLLSFWLALVNAALATAWLCRHKGRKRLTAHVGIGAAVVLCVTVYGHLRMQAVEQATAQTPTLHVGVVQGNIGVDDDGDSAVIYREMSLALARTESQLDLIIWPEGAVSYPTQVSKLSQFFRNHGLRDRRKGAAAEWLAVPILSGMTIANNTVDKTTSGARRVGDLLTLDQTDLEDLFLSNAAVLVAPTGHILGIYDKQHLMPVGERAPLADWFPQMQTITPPKTAYIVTRPAEALTLNDHRLYVSICYEDILYEPFRATVQQVKPDLLINLTNDGWFSGSAASQLHFALARLRAVEHRRWLLRVTNDGVTSLVAPTGHITWTLPPHQRVAGTTTVGLRQTQTLYGRVGDTPWYATLILALFFIWRKRRPTSVARNGE